MNTAREISSDIYRGLVKPRGLVSSLVRVKQSDILISADRALSREGLALVLKLRRQIEGYIDRNPFFLRSLVPLEKDEDAPEIVQAMIEASAKAGVGPMAAVAGAIADFVGRELMGDFPDLIVENGGDIFLRSSVKREVLLLAESSAFKGLKIAVGPTLEPIGICTSSGKLGHSFSYGSADAVTIIAASAAMADATATAIANVVKAASDIERGIECAREMAVDGVLIVMDDRLGAWGQVEIIG